VAFRNLQRVREAIRTVEEACRSTATPELTPRFEALRYRLYSLEKGIGHLAGREGFAGRLERAHLYLLVTESLCRKPVAETVDDALRAGVDIVQLREKSLSDRELLRRAIRLREATARAGALFVVNDRPAVAILSHADGLHLGQDDLPLAGVRRVVGHELLIGISTHSLEEARRAAREGADYVGVGPMFRTATKDAGPLLGPRGLRGVLAEIALPAFAIGGIGERHLQQIIDAGGRRVAISSAILSSPDVAGTVRRIKERLQAGPPGERGVPSSQSRERRDSSPPKRV
jgi:thiamine-phosphate pyrophosphorylase